MLKVGRETWQILVALPLWNVASLFGGIRVLVRSDGFLLGRIFPLLLLLATLPTLLVHEHVLAARVGFISGLLVAGGVLLGGAGVKDKSALRVVLMHGQQDGVLVYVAAVLGLLVRRGGDDGAGVLLGQ
jgi:hypothetical protein